MNVFKKIDITKQTGFSYETVLRRVKKLEGRCGLRVVSQVNYSRIGLTHLVILVEGEAYIESPYLISRHEFVGGKGCALFSIAIPSRVVKKVKKDFEKRFSRLWFWTVYRFENVNSFDFYDVNLKNWNIPWTAWSIYLDDLLSGVCDEVAPPKEKIITNKNETVIPEGKDITVEDLRLIVTLLKRFDTPVEILGQKLGYSTGGAARAKNSLLERGILQPCLGIEHIGLNERILFIVESDMDTLNSFVTAIKELPRALIYWMKPLDEAQKSSLACWLETPPGSFIKLVRIIRETPHVEECMLFPESMKEESTVPLLELFNPRRKSWRWSSKFLKITA